MSSGVTAIRRGPCSLRQDKFADRHGRGVDPPDLVAAEFAEKGDPRVYDNPVRFGPGGGGGFEGYFPGCRIKPSHEVAPLNGEPEHSFAVEDRGVRVPIYAAYNVFCTQLTVLLGQRENFFLQHSGRMLRNIKNYF